MRNPPPLSFGNWLMSRADDSKYRDLTTAYVYCLINGCYNEVPGGMGEHGQPACSYEVLHMFGFFGSPRLFADRWGPKDLMVHLRGIDPRDCGRESCWAADPNVKDFDKEVHQALIRETVLEDWAGWCATLRGQGLLAPILGEPQSRDGAAEVQGLDEIGSVEFDCGCTRYDHCHAHEEQAYGMLELKNLAEKVHRLTNMRLALPSDYLFLPGDRDTADVLYEHTRETRWHSLSRTEAEELKARCLAMMRRELPDDFQLLPDGRKTVETLYELATEEVRVEVSGATSFASLGEARRLPAR